MNLKSIKHRLKRQFYNSTSIFRQSLGTILYFHRITKPETPTIGPWKYAIAPKTLKKFLSEISEGQNFVSIDKFITNLKQKNKPGEKQMLLTFDDGYSDFYTNALPVLKELGIPATLFVTPTFIDNETLPYEFILYDMVTSLKKLEFRDGNTRYEHSLSSPSEQRKAYKKITELLKHRSRNERDELLTSINEGKDLKPRTPMMLSREQLRELEDEPLITIGLHGYEHVPVTARRVSDLMTNLKEAEGELEALLQKKVRYFSYPYGEANFEATEVLSELGIEAAFTTEERDVYSWDGNEPFLLPRNEGSRVIKRSMTTYVQEINNR